MQQEQYEEVEFCNSTNIMNDGFESQDQFADQPLLLSKKEEDEMLYSIKIKDDENLLDLSYEQESTVADNFKYKDFINERVCKVCEPLTIHDGYVITYKLYKIKTKKKHSKEFDTSVERRYSDFEYVHFKLIEDFGGCVIPCLPQKNYWATLDMQTPKDKKLRRKYLEKYINKLLQHPKLCYSNALKQFLFDNQKSFSAKKGGYTAQSKIQDKIRKFTFNIYRCGQQIAHNYLNRSKSGTTEQTVDHTLKNNSENQIFHYKILIDDMSVIMEKLKVTLDNTVQQYEQITSINSLAQQMLTSESSDFCKFSEEQQQNFDGDQNLKENSLVGKYQQIIDFIQSCKNSLDRWYNIRIQLNYLKQEQKQLNAKNNPRNARLDIIRSQINKNNLKINQWTKDLLEELESNIVLGKSLTARFIQEISNSRSMLYENYL